MYVYKYIVYACNGIPNRAYWIVLTSSRIKIFIMEDKTIIFPRDADIIALTRIFTR